MLDGTYLSVQVFTLVLAVVSARLVVKSIALTHRLGYGHHHVTFYFPTRIADIPPMLGQIKSKKLWRPFLLTLPPMPIYVYLIGFHK